MMTILEIWNFHQQKRLRNIIIERVCGIMPLVTFDAMPNSRSHSQLNTRKFVTRIW